MNESQKKKLLKAKANQSTDLDGHLGYFTDEDIKGIHSDIATIKSALAEALTYERDDLIESQKASLEKIDNTLKAFASNLQDKLDSHEPQPITLLTPELDGAVKKLVEISSKKPPVQKDVIFPEWLASDKSLKEVTKALNDVAKAVTVKPGQTPGDYLPFRRVIQVGNKLEYDDSFYTGGGGGSSIPTKNGSVPVVNPDGSNIGGSGAVTNDGTFATPARQDTGNTSLAGIKTQTDKLTFTGSKLQVDAVLDASEINIGQVNVLDTTDTEINPAKEDGNLATLTAKDFATQTTLAGVKTDLDEIATDTDKLDVNLSTRALESGGNLATIAGKDFATQTTLATRLSESDFDTKTGSLTETAPTTDTASSGLNGRLQRIAQRITSLITALGSPFQAGGSIGNTAFGVNNTSGASAVNIQDGGNSITVDGILTANPTTPTVVRYGQITVAVTNTAVQLTAGAGTGFVVQALAGNGGNVVIGDASVTTSNGFQLQPGQSTGVAIDNTNRVYVNGTSGDGVCWIGS